MQQWKEEPNCRRENWGLQLHSLQVSSADKFEGAFKEATRGRVAPLVAVTEVLVDKFLPKMDCGPGDKKSAASDLPSGRFCETAVV